MKYRKTHEKCKEKTAKRKLRKKEEHKIFHIFLRNDFDEGNYEVYYSCSDFHPRQLR